MRPRLESPAVRRPVAALVGALFVLAACGTGERPTLGATVVVGGGAGTPVGDVATDTVLNRLENVAGHTFTATYSLLRKFGNNETTATVVEDGDQVSVTVGDVRFVLGARTVTCSLAKGHCEDGTLDARISDYSLPSNFYATSPARALRVAFARKTADTIASDRTVAGAAATCVEIPLGGGSEHYCATSVGTVALWDTAATHVELTGLTDTADASAFAVPG
jgi:hypothetical protein